jgi:hypothetical protein
MNLQKLIIVTVGILALLSCKTLPTHFETGAEVAPPRGCVEGRERGVDC